VFRGDTLLTAQQIYVYQVKSDDIFTSRCALSQTKVVLERNGYHLCTQQYMFDLISFIVSKEVVQLKVK